MEKKYEKQAVVEKTLKTSSGREDMKKGSGQEDMKEEVINRK